MRAKDEGDPEDRGYPDGIDRVPWTIAELRVMVAVLEGHLGSVYEKLSKEMVRIEGQFATSAAERETVWSTG